MSSEFTISPNYRFFHFRPLILKNIENHEFLEFENTRRFFENEISNFFVKWNYRESETIFLAKNLEKGALQKSELVFMLYQEKK